MINKITEEWETVGGAMTRKELDDSADLKAVLHAIQGVQSALRQMSQVSVTRTTLRSAVKDCLRENPSELLPLAAPRESEGPLPSEVATRLDDFRERLERLSEREGELLASVEAQGRRMDDVDGRLSELQARLALVDERLGGFDGRFDELRERIEATSTGVGEVNFRAAEIDGRLGKADEGVRGLERDLRDGLQAQSEDIDLLKTAVDRELRGGLLDLEERFARVRKELEDLIAGVERSVPLTVERHGSELEARLRKEIEDMVEALKAKLADLRDALGRIEGQVPRREDLRSVDERLGRMEQGFARVASRVESIDSLTPELKLVGEKLLDLRGRLGAIDEGVGQAGRGVGDLRDSLSARLGDLHALVEAGIQRWEEDQSQMLERLSAIRDGLRDQLRDVGERAESIEPSLWGKITGKKEDALKLSREEWDRLSAKIEGIISGLESILARRQEKPRP
jgi:chromosome segregation ATPase